MVGYRPSFNKENSADYGTGGWLKYIDQSPLPTTLINSEISKQPEYQTTFNKIIFNESINKSLYSTKALPSSNFEIVLLIY